MPPVHEEVGVHMPWSVAELTPLNEATCSAPFAGIFHSEKCHPVAKKQKEAFHSMELYILLLKISRWKHNKFSCISFQIWGPEKRNIAWVVKAEWHLLNCNRKYSLARLAFEFNMSVNTSKKSRDTWFIVQELFPLWKCQQIQIKPSLSHICI